MSKAAMTCPFSNRACVECAVYRGRHFYLCFAKAHLGCKGDLTRYSTVKFLKPWEEDDDTLRMSSNIPPIPTVIFNVEDLIEKEELSRLKEKGETHDT